MLLVFFLLSFLIHRVLMCWTQLVCMSPMTFNSVHFENFRATNNALWLLVLYKRRKKNYHKTKCRFNYLQCITTNKIRWKKNAWRKWGKKYCHWLITDTMNNFRKSIFVSVMITEQDEVIKATTAMAVFFTSISVCRLIRLYICMSWPEFLCMIWHLCKTVATKISTIPNWIKLTI